MDKKISENAEIKRDDEAVSLHVDPLHIDQVRNVLMQGAEKFDHLLQTEEQVNQITKLTTIVEQGMVFVRKACNIQKLDSSLPMPVQLFQELTGVEQEGKVLVSNLIYSLKRNVSTANVINKLWVTRVDIFRQWLTKYEETLRISHPASADGLLMLSQAYDHILSEFVGDQKTIPSELKNEEWKFNPKISQFGSPLTRGDSVRAIPTNVDKHKISLEDISEQDLVKNPYTTVSDPIGPLRRDVRNFKRALGEMKKMVEKGVMLVDVTGSYENIKLAVAKMLVSKGIIKEKFQSALWQDQRPDLLKDTNIGITIGKSDLLNAEIIMAFARPSNFVEIQNREVNIFYFFLHNPDFDEGKDTIEDICCILVKPKFHLSIMFGKSVEETGKSINKYIDDFFSKKSEFTQYMESETHKTAYDNGLKKSGRIFGGIKNDIERRKPSYRDDWCGGAIEKKISVTIYMWLIQLSPILAFGGLMGEITNQELSIQETLVGAAFSSVLYAIFCGQPLTVLGATGPMVVFTEYLWKLCVWTDLPFLPMYSIVGIYTALLLLLMSFFDTSCYMSWCTEFTDDIFSALISFIFTIEPFKFINKHLNNSEKNGLLEMFLVFLTFLMILCFKSLGHSEYFRAPIRKALPNYSTILAIAVATLVSQLKWPSAKIDYIQGPSLFEEGMSTTTGRSWFIPYTDVPAKAYGIAILPAIFLTILFYLDQNITSRIVNSRVHKLKKGAGYHLDMLILSFATVFNSVFGMPWQVAATVRSLNHIEGCTTLEKEKGETKIVDVLESRVTGLGMGILIWLSLMFMPLLKYIPMSVLQGVFLSMGVGAMTNNNFIGRIKLFFIDPSFFPKAKYRINVRHIHFFTFIQLACLAVLWAVKSSPIGITFPLFLLFLIFVRKLLPKIIPANVLAVLDPEEGDEDNSDKENNPRRRKLSFELM